MPIQRPSSRGEFAVAIICALSREYDAVQYTFDEIWDDQGDQYGRAPGDTNQYTTGRIGGHNAVLTLLPRMGKTNAASAAAQLRTSYNGILVALIVGVCGAVPSTKDGKPIFLGDVIVSNRVVQYDFGRQYSDGFVPKKAAKDVLGRPNKEVTGLLNMLKTHRGYDRVEARTAAVMKQIQGAVSDHPDRRGMYDYPGVAHDRLYLTVYRHKHQEHQEPGCVCRDCRSASDSPCELALVKSCHDVGCEDSKLVRREHLRVRDGGRPHIYIGAVASGDAVNKSPVHRDKLAEEEDVLMMEMEGAGAWDELPCIVIKGVCDYADSHKNKDWQDFAAASAAAVAKAMLQGYTRTDRPPAERVAVPQTQGQGQSQSQSQSQSLNNMTNNFNGPISTPFFMPGWNQQGQVHIHNHGSG